MSKIINWLLTKRFNLFVRFKQKIYKNKTNYPYLSGDSFARACDVTVYNANKVPPTILADAYSIFCTGEKLEQFLEEYRGLINATILVVGNSDRDFYSLNCDFPRSVKAVYLQNSHISNGFFRTLPIGLENLRYGRNGLPSLFNYRETVGDKLNAILVGPYSPTHPEREELLPWGGILDDRIKFISNSLSPKKLANIASKYKYIACPRGNGTDTHRFWETLYRGSIPVVKKSLWSQSISDLGITLIQLNSWDFNEFCEEINNFNFDVNQPRESEILWMNYWEQILNSRAE
jgi:hypothetical protein